MPGLRRRQEQFRRGRGAARKARRSPEKERPAGEYGIIVSNPNNVDEKMVIVSAFAIDGGAAAKE